MKIKEEKRKDFFYGVRVVTILEKYAPRSARLTDSFTNSLPFLQLFLESSYTDLP